MHNAAISAAKLQNYCRIAKGIDKITQILRRFFSQNAEIRQIVGKGLVPAIRQFMIDINPSCHVIPPKSSLE